MDKDLPLSEHLTELRRRLLAVLIPLALLLPLCYWGSEWALERLFAPLRALGYELYLYHLTEGFLLKLRVALLMDLLLLAPWLLGQALRFAWPGLYPEEKRAALALTGLCGAMELAMFVAWLFWLTPWLTGLWHRYFGKATTMAFLSAEECYGLWAGGALVCAALALIPAAWWLFERYKGHWKG